MKYSHYLNTNRLSKAAEDEATTCVRNLANWSTAVEEIRTWPEYSPQPLHTLPGHAKKLGINRLYIKDESKRFGTKLGSFKALGAPYAVYRILAKEVFEKTGTYPSSTELRTSKYHDIVQNMTVCVATDGNQGRGLAYGAKIFGCRCVDYIHNHVSEGRANAMKELGAIVIRIDGEYEASVERAKKDASMNGWYFVSSTSWSDYDNDVPQHVMNAYMVVVYETLCSLPSASDITHVFVCGGVGSIAAAIFQGFYMHLNAQSGTSAKLPRFVLVEPSEADCLLQSAKSGSLRQSEGSLSTLMAGLACRTPSPAAWKLLTWLTSDFMSVPDSAAEDGMKQLASGSEGDIPLVIGESSAATMGVMLGTMTNPALRHQLGLESESQVILFGLEGATDPAIYNSVVGLSPEVVYQRQKHFRARMP